MRVGVPIQIYGLTISTGDILHGDENGLVSVPLGCQSKIPDVVNRVCSRERKLMDWVRSDAFSLEGFHDHVVE